MQTVEQRHTLYTYILLLLFANLACEGRRERSFGVIMQTHHATAN